MARLFKVGLATPVDQAGHRAFNWASLHKSVAALFVNNARSSPPADANTTYGAGVPWWDSATKDLMVYDGTAVRRVPSILPYSGTRYLIAGTPGPGYGYGVFWFTTDYADAVVTLRMQINYLSKAIYQLAEHAHDIESVGVTVVAAIMPTHNFTIDYSEETHEHTAFAGSTSISSAGSHTHQHQTMTGGAINIGETGDGGHIHIIGALTNPVAASGSHSHGTVSGSTGSAGGHGHDVTSAVFGNSGTATASQQGSASATGFRVYLDGVQRNTTGNAGDLVLTSFLTPGTHRIEFRKDGGSGNVSINYWLDVIE